MTALSFVWVHPYSQNSGCDIYSEYDSEVEMLNNRKVICHEYA